MSHEPVKRYNFQWMNPHPHECVATGDYDSERTARLAAEQKLQVAVEALKKAEHPASCPRNFNHLRYGDDCNCGIDELTEPPAAP